MVSASTPTSPLYRRLCRLLLRGRVEALREADRRNRGEVNGAPRDETFAKVPPPASPRDGITLRELIANYKKDRGAKWSPKTRDGYTLIFRAFEELLGEDRPVKLITRHDCRSMRDILIDLAPNYTKRPETKGKSMEEAARISRRPDKASAREPMRTPAHPTHVARN